MSTADVTAVARRYGVIILDSGKLLGGYANWVGEQGRGLKIMWTQRDLGQTVPEYLLPSAAVCVTVYGREGAGLESGVAAAKRRGRVVVVVAEYATPTIRARATTAGAALTVSGNVTFQGLTDQLLDLMGLPNPNAKKGQAGGRTFSAVERSIILLSQQRMPILLIARETSMPSDKIQAVLDRHRALLAKQAAPSR